MAFGDGLEGGQDRLGHDVGTRDHYQVRGVHFRGRGAARAAIDLTRSVPAALSPVAMTAQDGRFFHAGVPMTSEKAASAISRCVAARTAACSGGRSTATTSWNLVGSTTNSVAVPPLAVGYWPETRAVERIASLTGRYLAELSPSSGAKAATNTSPTTFDTRWAAPEITAPAYEWPTRRAGLGV